MQMPTYEQFKSTNDYNKKHIKGIDKGQIGRIKNMNDAYNAVCEFSCYDNLSVVQVKDIVAESFYNNFGVLTNPSALKSWSGWGRDI
jgi:hypothetical protein